VTVSMLITCSALGLVLGTCQVPVPRARADRRAERMRAVLSAAGTYLTSNLLLLVAGLVSMPIMTRLLSKSDYGLLSLIFATVAVLAVVGGLGFGEAAVRLYDEHKAEGGTALRQLCDSLLGGSLGMGLLVACAVCAVAMLSPGIAVAYGRCLLLGGLLVAVRIVSAVLFQIYRAQERAVAHATTQVLVRYATSALAIALLLAGERSAFTVILASLVVEAAAVAVRLVDLRRRGVISRPRLAAGPLAAAAVYGVPLALAGGARFLLDYGDRFVIERLLDLSAVATYSVAYDLAQKLADTLFGPLQLAFVPVLFRVWGAEGVEGTARFASRMLTYMIALTIPVALLYWVLNEQLIVVLASTRYRDSSALTPFLLPGVMMGGLNFIAIAGLTIQKRTAVLAVTVGVGAVFNLALNLLLVPRYGLTGAALATTLAYSTLAVTNYVLSRSVLRLRIDGAVVVRAVVASAVMLLAVAAVGHGAWPPLVDLAVRGTVGCGAILACMWVLDRDVRRWVATRVAAAGGGTTT